MQHCHLINEYGSFTLSPVCARAARLFLPLLFCHCLSPARVLAERSLRRASAVLYLYESAQLRAEDI